MTLYHYTCSCCAHRIGRYGMLMPWKQPMLGGVKVIWLTDSVDLDREALGLTNNGLLKCDRMEFRYIVETVDVVSWREWANGRVPNPIRSELEHGRCPEHWFMMFTAVLAKRDLAYRR